jgi:hypothetical protein
VDLDDKNLGANGGTDDFALPDELNVLFEIGCEDRETLAYRNDLGRPFAEIADWIEKNIDVED